MRRRLVPGCAALPSNAAGTSAHAGTLYACGATTATPTPPHWRPPDGRHDDRGQRKERCAPEGVVVPVALVVGHEGKAHQRHAWHQPGAQLLLEGGVLVRVVAHSCIYVRRWGVGGWRVGTGTGQHHRAAPQAPCSRSRGHRSEAAGELNQPHSWPTHPPTHPGTG